MAPILFSIILPIKFISYVELRLTTLPAELGQLQSLQLLRIEAKRLINLPIELGQLQSLQSFHIRTNKSCVFPPEIDYLEERGVKITRCVYQS